MLKEKAKSQMDSTAKTVVMNLPKENTPPATKSEKRLETEKELIQIREKLIARLREIIKMFSPDTSLAKMKPEDSKRLLEEYQYCSHKSFLIKSMLGGDANSIEVAKKALLMLGRETGQEKKFKTEIKELESVLSVE